MNKKKIQETLQVLIKVPAMVQAIIGKKRIRKIFKHLRKLPPHTEINVWMFLHNMIDPINTVSVNIKDEKERSVVIEEACYIYALMKSTPCKDGDALVEETMDLAKKRKEMIHREYNRFFQDGKWKDLRQIHPEGYCQRD